MPNRTKKDQKGSKRTKKDQKGPKRTKKDQKGPKKTRFKKGSIKDHNALKSNTRFPQSQVRVFVFVT